MKKGQPRQIPYRTYLVLEKEKERFATRVGQLEATLAELEAQLKGQATELSTMGSASLEIRREDVAQLADFERENKALIEFVEKIANTKSKYAREARRLLGNEKSPLS